jgi:Mg2+ and Co2+ transporter CorA
MTPQRARSESTGPLVAAPPGKAKRRKPGKQPGDPGTHLFDLRHDLEAIRTSAAQAAESFANLIETMDLQEGLMQTDLRRVRNSQQGFRHLQHTADLEREYLQEMIDLFQTRVSTELNRFVRKVTAWGSIGIAWTVIVGLYGMNFTHMPELGWRWGYPAVLVVMLIVGVLLVLLFRRRGWL